MVFNTTFKNISVILWWLVLLEETGENHRPATSVVVVGCGSMVFNATFKSTIFSYIMAVNSIGGGNRSTRRKPPTCRNALTNFIT